YRRHRRRGRAPPPAGSRAARSLEIAPDEPHCHRLLTRHVDRLRRPARYRTRPHLARGNEEAVLDHLLEGGADHPALARHRFRSEAPASFPVHAHFNLLSPVWRRAHASPPLRDRTARRPWAAIRRRWH